jgi:hypothetical protein
MEDNKPGCLARIRRLQAFFESLSKVATANLQEVLPSADPRMEARETNDSKTFGWRARKLVRVVSSFTMFQKTITASRRILFGAKSSEATFAREGIRSGYKSIH